MTNKSPQALILVLLYLLPTTARGQTDSGFQPLLPSQPLLLDAAPAAAPSTTQPLTSQAQAELAGQPQTQTAEQRTVAEFIGHFSGYDPMYFIAGPVSPVVKFQVSFKYRLLNPDAPLAKHSGFLAGLHFSYTQLALWALDKPSEPFTDINFKPEFFWSNEDIRAFKIPGVSVFGLQSGFGHESNGRGGADSRSQNIVFARPIFTFFNPEGFHLTLAPKFYYYIGDLSDNPDLPDYRGYCDFRTIIGWRQGLELSTVGRVGGNWNRGSIQLDLTYPLRNLLMNNFDVYLWAQYFYGYGESLLTYNQRSNAFRIGLGIIR
jgi:outer membrane phospholipase A